MDTVYIETSMHKAFPPRECPSHNAVFMPQFRDQDGPAMLASWAAHAVAVTPVDFVEFGGSDTHPE